MKNLVYIFTTHPLVGGVGGRGASERDLVSPFHRRSNWDSKVETVHLWLPRERNKAGRSLAPGSQLPFIQALLDAKAWSATERWRIILPHFLGLFLRFFKLGCTHPNYWNWEWQTTVLLLLMWYPRLSILILIWNVIARVSTMKRKCNLGIIDSNNVMKRC